MRSSSPLEVQSLPWLLLVVGFLLGRSDTSPGMTALEILLATWQSWVNTVLVPIYALCVFLYLGPRLWKDLDLRVLLRKSKPSVREDAEPLEEEEFDEEGPKGLSGAYKLVKNDNFDGFLEAQGVPWALRRAADKARPIHRITHRGNKVRIQIRGLIESETTYQVNGPPVEVNIRGRIFRDSVVFLEGGDGIRVTKVATQENYNIEVTRRWSEDRQTITMTSRAIFNDGQDPVVSVQLFERVE